MPKKVEPVVKVALDMWKSDMLQVTGMQPVASSRPKVKVVLGKGAADGFRIYVKGGQIIIEGGNGRGMAYGILELSRLAGVSPWIWWGDVVPEKKGRLVLDDHFSTGQQPSVEYRGIFLNDEDWSLRHWSYSHFEPAPFGHIGPQTYKKIFQLLLRLRANAIWPGMHTGTTAFFKIPGAKAMADSCGIVIGTSHCEPLLRNNVDEWDVKERGAFNYRTNREAVQSYWIERLQEVRKSKDNMFTIGMRGIHDSSMEGYQTDQEKLDGLQQVINDQQDLLRKYIGSPEKQMQVFVPYKEVLQLYEKGLKVPDYVTLMWCDDNYGYMTRLSDAQEQKRQGGGGVYYHLSYWGRPHDYLWLTTTQPGLIYNEMRQAHDHHVRKLWIVNVHDPKVAGYDLELFLDMAWNINCVTGETLNDHYKAWLCREFGQEAGERLFPVMHEFYRLCGIRRPEFMGWNQVEVDKKLYDRGLSQVRNSGWTTEEKAYFLNHYAQLSQQVEEIGHVIRPELIDAYFTTIKYPVQAAAAHAEKMLEAENARLLATGSTRSDMFEHRQELQQAVARSQAAYNRIHELTDYYNNKVACGKWKNLMCDHPRDLPVFWAPLTPTVSQADASPGPGERIPGRVSPRRDVAACDYEEASEGVKTIQMLGHSMNAVALPKGGELTYRFTIDKSGDYTLCTALIPTQPNDNGDLRYSVSIDGGEPVVYSLKEPFRSEEWKQNVLRAQALRYLTTQLSEGTHKLTIRAIDDHIVIDQWSVSMHLPKGTTGQDADKSLARHNFFYAGESKQQRMFIVNDGHVSWQWTNPQGRGEISDAVLLSDGHVLVAHQYGICEVTQDNNTLWSYAAPEGTEIHTIQPIGRDHVLFVQNGHPAKVVVMKIPSCQIEYEFEVPASEGVHGQFRNARLSSRGTLLLAHMGQGYVAEYSVEGNELGRWEVPAPWSVTEYANDRMLFVGRGLVREIDRASGLDKVIREIKTSDYGIHSPQKAVRLKNGNTIINDWYNEWSKTPMDTLNAPVQAIEIDKNGQVVWQLSSWKGPDLGPSTTIQPLDQAVNRDRLSFGHFNGRSPKQMLGVNQPVGEGRGIHPGRVAWIHSPGVAKWDGYTGLWVEDRWNDQQKSDQMVKEAILQLTGEKTAKKGWQALFKHFNKGHGKGNRGYKKGEMIAVKLNLNNALTHRDTFELNSSPFVTLALVRSMVHDGGIQEQDIVLCEPSRAITDSIYNKVHREFPQIRFIDNIGGDGREKCEYYPEQIAYSQDNGKLARGLAKCIVDADYLINSSLLKTHVGPGVTLTTKNWYGATDISLFWRNNAHNGFSQDKRNGKPGYKTFVDWLSHKHLGQKALFCLIDGTYGSRHVNGKPFPKWQKPPFNNEWCCSLIVSQDEVACDAVGMDLIISEWPEYQSLSYCDEYLIEAASLPNPPSGTTYKQDGKPLEKPLGLMEHCDKDRNYNKLDLIYKKL